MTYYVCNYADYTNLPIKLFLHNTEGMERKSLDGTKFVVWCDVEAKSQGFLSWMNGSEVGLTHGQVLSVVTSAEWQEEQ